MTSRAASVFVISAWDASPTADAGSTTDAGAISDGGDGGPFATAAHTPFPSVPRAAGPILASPKIITVTFADHPDLTQISAFGDWIATSSWLAAVGKDYGVGVGTHTHVTLPTPATTSFADADVQKSSPTPSRATRVRAIFCT